MMHLNSRSGSIILLAGMLLLYQLVYAPSRRSLLAMRAAIEKKKQDASELQKICQEYRKIAPASGVRHRVAPANFSLIAFIGQQVDHLDLRTHVREVKPLPPRRAEDLTVERANIVLEGMTIDKVYALLETIELRTPAVAITTFQMKRDRDRPHTLSCELELCVIKEAGASPSTKPQQSHENISH